MAVLADIKEVAGHSELNADAQFDQLLSELQQRLASYQDRLLDVEDGTIALFKLAVLGTRKGDDVEASAGVWKTLAEFYDRRSARVEEVFRSASKASRSLERTSRWPAYRRNLTTSLKS